MENINYDQLLQLFVDDRVGSTLTHPFTQDGYCYATDRIALIRLPKHITQLDYPEQERPKCSAVIPNKTINIGININHLSERLIPEMIPETVICDACCGEGEVTWEFEGHEKEDECPKCDGDGKIKTNTGKMIPNDNKIYKIYASAFSYMQLIRLIDACKIMGVEEITQVHSNPVGANIFICGDASILIMAYNDANNEATVIY